MPRPYISPLLFHESLMIEPTETECLETIDNFIAAMREIAEDAYHVRNSRRVPLMRPRGSCRRYRSGSSSKSYILLTCNKLLYMYHKEFDNIIGAGPAGMRPALLLVRGRERVRGRTQRCRWHMPQSRLHTHKGSCPVGIGDIRCRISPGFGVGIASEIAITTICG